MRKIEVKHYVARRGRSVADQKRMDRAQGRLIPVMRLDWMYYRIALGWSEEKFRRADEKVRQLRVNYCNAMLMW